MKKISCILLVVIMLIGCCIISVSADEQQDKGMFYQEFVEQFCMMDGYSLSESVLFYEEVYFDYSLDGELEWVLVNAASSLFNQPWERYPIAVLEDRIVRVHDMSAQGPFYATYGVYVVSEEKFIDIVDAVKSDEYCDKIFAYFAEHSIDEFIGDMDKDRKITIKDATYLQKCLAGIENYPENDEVMMSEYSDYDRYAGYGYLAYVSDFNRDKVRNIKDATAIQKYLAGITEE